MLDEAGSFHSSDKWQISLYKLFRMNIGGSSRLVDHKTAGVETARNHLSGDGV